MKMELLKGDINWFLLFHNLHKLHSGVTVNTKQVVTSCSLGKYSWRALLQ